MLTNPANLSKFASHSAATLHFGIQAPLTETSELSGSAELGQLSGGAAPAVMAAALDPAPPPSQVAQPLAHALSLVQPASQPAAAEGVAAEQSTAGLTTAVASTAAMSPVGAATEVVAQAPLRASGAALSDTAALIRLVAAAAAAARTAERGNSTGATGGRNASGNVLDSDSLIVQPLCCCCADPSQA